MCLGEMLSEFTTEQILMLCEINKTFKEKVIKNCSIVLSESQSNISLQGESTNAGLPWQRSEEEKLMQLIEKNPDNIQRAFSLCSIALGRSHAAVTQKYYNKLRYSDRKFSLKSRFK